MAQKKLRHIVMKRVFPIRLEQTDHIRLVHIFRDTSDLKAYRNMYQIPNDITLRLPELDEFSSAPKEGEIIFHEKLFHFGLRLSIQ